MSRLESSLKAGAFPVVLEVTPPRRLGERVLLRRAGRLGRRPEAVNVIHRPDRLSSVEAAGVLCARGLEPVWHLVTRGRSPTEIEREIARAREAGLRQVLCIRGDQRLPDRADTPRIREVVEWVRREIPKALVGVAMNQAAPHDRALRNVLPKLRAGATFVQTQPVFGWGPFAALASRLKHDRSDALVLPMLMPLRTADAARRLEARIGVRVPALLVERLQRYGGDAGWEAFAETLARLYESPLADGVAVMTLELDPPDEFGARLESVLREVLGPPRELANSASKARRKARCAGLL